MKINIDIDSGMLVEIFKREITGCSDFKSHEILKILPKKYVKNLCGELCTNSFSTFIHSAPRGRVINKFIMLGIQHDTIRSTAYFDFGLDDENMMSKQQCKIMQIYYKVKNKMEEL